MRPILLKTSTALLVLLTGLVMSQSAAAQQDLVIRARDAAGRGDWASAIRDYGGLVRTNPRVAEFHLNLGIALYSAGQPGNAIAPLRRALKLKPGLVQARYFLGAALAETGQCQEALGYIKKDAPSTAGRELGRTAALAGVRCSMKLNLPDHAVDFIRRLNRDFPNDPEVLYLTVHVYSDLSIRAAQGLITGAPASYQVRLLNAEALETQGKWDEAAAEYRQVLKMNPNLPGIHYRLGRLLLSLPDPSPDVTGEARREFEEELKTDPTNAGAAYVLGELARRDHQWAEAIGYFSRAVALDPLFADAFIGLGRSLIANRQFPEAVAPLERAVTLQPDNPAGHYHLGIAYNRVGRKQDADREAALFREAADRARQIRHDVQIGILGPQKAEP